MKKFFVRYGYAAVHLFVVQVVIGLFGLMLALAAGMAKNITLRTVSSVFAIVFFLFLEFSAAWRVGSEDKISVEKGSIKKNLLVPVKIWLLSSSVNFLLALLITLGILFPDAFSGLGAVAVVIKGFTEGMYTGVIALSVGGVQLNTLWYVHFLTSLPALLAIFTAYVCGLKNINFGGLFVPNGGIRR